MTADEALKRLEAIAPALSLTTLQEQIFRATWEGRSYPAIAQAVGYDREYVKYVGSQLWRSLSQVLGQKVTKANVRAVLQRYQRQQEVSSASAPVVDWGDAIDATRLYGRDAELATLAQWLERDYCRLVVLLGMGGIGKTALAVKLAQQLAEEPSAFPVVVWRSLRNAPPLRDLLTDLLWVVSGGTVVGVPESIDAGISQLLTYLRGDRCLLVLDNGESLLQPGGPGGAYRAGYENYADLLRQLGEVPHRSSVLLTSRELPQPVAAMMGVHSPASAASCLPVRCLQVGGLGAAAGQQIILETGITATSEECQHLVARCSGNPLALKISATAIHLVFGNQIAAFLTEAGTLAQEMRTLLAHQVDRLTQLEQQIMGWLAISREPMSLPDLQQDLLPPPPRTVLLDALQSLRHRSLIESVVDAASPRFTLQPVVMEYVTHRVIEQVCAEILALPTPVPHAHLHHQALFKATAPEYVREAQRSLILQPAIAHLCYRLGSQAQLAEHLRAKVAALRQAIASKSAANPAGGYAGGTLLNLLSELETNLSGWDFSGLCLWQTDFRRQPFHRVNLAHTDLARCGFIQPFGSVMAVAYSPDGHYLATGDTGCEVRIWDLRTGQVLRVLQGHQGWVETLAFHPSLPLVASGSNDWTIRLWDVRVGACGAVLKGHQAWVTGVAFSPDGRCLASGSTDGTIRLWNVATHQCDRVLEGHAAGVRAIAFSPDGSFLASGGDDRIIRLWNLETATAVGTFGPGSARVCSLAFDGDDLASGHADGMVRLWAIATGECLQSLHGHGDRVDAVCLRPYQEGEARKPSSARLASGSLDQTLRLWQLPAATCLGVLRGHGNWVTAIAPSPDGQRLASAGYDQTVRLWNWDTRQCEAVLQGYTNSVIAVAVHPHRPLVASAGQDGIVRLWDLPSGRCLRSLRGHTNQVWRLAFSPSGDWLASGSVDATIRLWQVETGQCQRCLLNRSPWVFGLAFHPDGRTLVSTGKAAAVAAPAIQRWDITSGDPLQDIVIRPHAEKPIDLRALAISPDGGAIATGGNTCTVELRDLSTGEQLMTLTGHTGYVEVATFSPDGQWLVSGGGDRTLRIWHLPTGKRQYCLEGHTDQIRGVSISPDGRLLASVSNDQTVRLWELASGSCVKVLEGHTNGVYAVTFARFGVDNELRAIATAPPLLVSGGLDETVRLWDITTGQCLQVLQAARPYEGVTITGAKGLTPAQASALRALGAVGESSP